MLGLDARHALAVVELAAGAALQRRRRRRRPPARGPAPGTGGGRCCGRGGTGMRSRGPPGSGPAACGTRAPSRRALIWGRAAAELPAQGPARERARSTAARPVRASVALERAATPRRRPSARRRSACPSRVAACSGSSRFGGDRGEHVAAHRGGRPGGRRRGRRGSGTGGARRPGRAPAPRWRPRPAASSRPSRRCSAAMPGEGEEDDRGVAHPAGRVERSLVGRLGPRQLAVVEQHPSEAGEERPGEAAEQRLVGLDGGLERRDRGGVVAGPLVEVGDHAEAHREHDGPVEPTEALGGRAVVPLGLGEVAVEERELAERVRREPRRRTGRRATCRRSRAAPSGGGGPRRGRPARRRCSA